MRISYYYHSVVTEQLYYKGHIGSIDISDLCWMRPETSSATSIAESQRLGRNVTRIVIIITGVICDPKMPIKLIGQDYKSNVRPVLTYGSEAWPLLERHRQLLHVTEMKMLRWMCGVTRKDRVRNTYIRGSLHVCDIADKLSIGSFYVHLSYDTLSNMTRYFNIP